MLLYCLVLILVIAVNNIIKIVVRNRKFSELCKHFKQNVIPSYPILGVSYIFFGNNETRMKAIQRLGRLVNDNGGIAGGWFGLRYFVVISDAKIADLVMKNCLEKDPMMDTLKYIFGNGNVVAPVQIWRSRRRTLLPAFAPAKLSEYIPIFIKNTEILASRLQTKVGAGPFALWSYLTACNMDSVCESVFGIKLGAQHNPDVPFLKANTEGSKLLGERICQPWLHSDIIFEILPRFRKLKEYKNIIYDFLREVIQKRRKEFEDDRSGKEEKVTQTFLDQLIKSSTYSEEELLEECLTLVLAGIDTTSITAGFTLLALGKYPHVQERVFDELIYTGGFTIKKSKPILIQIAGAVFGLREVFGDSPRPVFPEDLHRLRYLEAVIKETSRLYPAFATLLRQVTKELKLPSGVTLVEDCGVMINTWAIHRNPQYWGLDAEEFHPDRFLVPLQHPAQFMPFSYGPRNCPGYQYALLSLKATLATLLLRFRVLPGSDQPLRLSFDVMMKDADEFLVQLQDRKSPKHMS